MKADRIPIVGTHRGIGLHDCQSAERLELVRAAIDRVFHMENILDLVDFAADRLQPPEARMYAASKVKALYELAAERRENRPEVNLDRVRASVAALDSAGVRSKWRYTSIYDPYHDRAVERETPIEDAE